MTTWITLYPQWFISERNDIARQYPEFRVDEGLLRAGVLCYYGELVVRPSSGAKRHSIRLMYPAGSPLEPAAVTPVESLPEFDEDGAVKDNKHPNAKFFDRRHQMPGGALCLFQRETRGGEGGEWIQATDVLRRAEKWFLGHHTGRWPPDSRESELESHFFLVGDVLLSKTFYSKEIEGCGEFYMVRDMRRLLDGAAKEDPPLIVTVITKTSGIHAHFDAREDLQYIYPWLGNDAWSPEKLAERQGRNQREPNEEDKFFQLVTERGHWWSLDQEPEPFHDGAGLVKVLSRASADGDGWKILSDALGTDLTTFSKHFIGLRYPGRTGGVEWLVLYMQEQVKPTTDGGLILASGDDQKRRVFERTRVSCYRVHGARPEDIQLRNSTVVDTQVRDKTVALIGLGALGSKVAELLTQAGVGHFRICDNDWLSTGNVARHVGGLRDFGLRKTRVVMTRLFDINPHLQVTAAWDASAISDLERLQSFMGEADLTICTTADENVESAINQVAVVDKKTVLYGRALRRGNLGRVFLVRPGVDACKFCLGHYARMKREGKSAPADWVEVPERPEDVLLHECGRPVIPASAVDLSFVASLISRVALDVLECRETEKNHWIWSVAPARDVDERLDSPLSTMAGCLPRHEGCVVCEEPDVAGLVLSKQVREAIVSEVESSISTETGGILLGYVNDERKAVVVRATGPGPNARKSAGGFDRDVEFVQKELERAAGELGEQGLYVGEWHSHLETDPEPSGIDITSMCGIASSTNYATRCPVLIIAGIEETTGKVSKLKGWSFPVSGRVFSVEVAE